MSGGVYRMKCPLCKSENIKNKKKKDNNRVCGPGYSSWIIDEYYVCKDCGKKKKKICPGECIE